MFVKCNCNNCSAHLEFDDENAGQIIACPKCGLETLLYVQSQSQHPPISLPISAPKTNPAAKRKANTIKNIVAIGIFMVVLVGCFWVRNWRIQKLTSMLSETPFGEPVKEDETYAQRLLRYRAKAEQSVRVACTNDVVGLRQVMQTDLSTYQDNYKNWRASATVEFFNKMGGVERTNLDFRFDMILDDLYCIRIEKLPNY